MTKPDKSKADGAELWERVIATASPLGKIRRTPVKGKPIAADAIKTDKTANRTPVNPPRDQRATPVPQRAHLDRQTARRLESGRLEVEARLDLHGLRQRDAHVALRRFLKAAQAKGQRHVLIITGKGAEPGAGSSFYEEERRGVLKQAVPGWLAQPEFAALVVSFSPAPRRLGGEGALYVRLRKVKG